MIQQQKTWNGRIWKKDMQILQKTLKFSNLSIGEQIDYRSVKIYQKDHIHQIFTNNQNRNLPHIVLMHGFGGTSMTFIKFFKSLNQYYRVHALDTFGVGNSSSGVFKLEFTYNQVISYYINAIQQWRKNLQIQQFVLVGHSFGGYLSACYTQRYPDRVSRLILLSPVGSSQKSPKQAEQQLKKRYQKDGVRGKFFMYFAQRVFNMQIKPSKAIGSYFIGRQLINRIVDVRLKLKYEQNQAWKEYLSYLSGRQSPSQIGFYTIFQWPLKTIRPIQAMIHEMNFQKPIQFYFGQYDWMDTTGAQKLQKQFETIKFNRISKSDHQLIFDNPDQICYYILLRRTPKQLRLQSQIQKENVVIHKNSTCEQKVQQINQKKQILQILQNLQTDQPDCNQQKQITILDDDLLQPKNSLKQ